MAAVAVERLDRWRPFGESPQPHMDLAGKKSSGGIRIMQVDRLPLQ